MLDVDAASSARHAPPDWFGPWLAAHRRSLGLYQWVAAQRVGISRGHLSKMENSLRCPSESVALKLADLYRLSELDRRLLMRVAVVGVGHDLKEDGLFTQRVNDMPRSAAHRRRLVRRLSTLSDGIGPVRGLVPGELRAPGRGEQP